MADDVSDDSVQEVMLRARLRWNDRRKVIAGLARMQGLNDSGLARKMGMSRQTLSTRLSGQSTITPWEMDGFAVVLGVERQVLEGDPTDALQWVINNKPELLRSRCFAGSSLVAAA